MRGNFDLCLQEVLKHEGGYVNHPKDTGGMTNLGVTKRVYEEWVGHPVNEAIMRGLTVAHVRALYKAKYWDVVKGDDLPADPIGNGGNGAQGAIIILYTTKTNRFLSMF